jgi:hypothetical protein
MRWRVSPSSAPPDPPGPAHCARRANFQVNPYDFTFGINQERIARRHLHTLAPTTFKGELQRRCETPGTLDLLWNLTALSGQVRRFPSAIAVTSAFAERPTPG